VIGRRQPSAGARIFPIVAALLAALEGCALPSPAIPARQPAPPASLTSPLTQGNEARILVDGPATHEAMRAAIARARDHVDLESYIIDDSAIGERFAELLKQKAAQGVKVNVIYDSVGSIKTPHEFFRDLRDAGVAVCEFNPVKRAPAKLNHRDHRKILVVDGRAAFTGGINISETYASGSARARRDPDKERDRKDGWRDTQVQVWGPVVAQLQRLFLDAWALQDCGPAPEARYFPPLERRGDKAMRVVRSDPDSGTSEMYAVLLDRIRNARSRVWLTVGYFVPDPQIKEALMQAARRGVDVRLMLPGFSDFWAPVYAARSHYEDLLGAGVRVYEWREALIHAKTAVIDSNWSSVGSTNLDWRSFVLNYEDDLVVRDAAFARQMEELFLRDVAASVQIDPAKWRARRPGEKLKEWFARQWEYLL
jgi:cardiolipin synthase